MFTTLLAGGRGTDLRRGRDACGDTVTGRQDVVNHRVRRVGHLWIVATLPLAALVGLMVDSQQDYLLAFVFVGTLLVLPALAVTVVVMHRVPRTERRFWWLFAIGLGLISAIGVSMVVQVFVSFGFALLLGIPLVVTCTAVLLGALFDFVRTRSSIRVHALDVLESAMLVIAVCAFLPLAWGNRPIVLSALWFTIPATAATVGVLAGFCWSLAMFRRVSGQMLPDEALGTAIGLICSINAVAQMAQGMTGFQLPASPLLVAQAACFGVVLLTALRLAHRAPSGYDTLPPIEQTRARPLDTIAIALLVPLLVITVYLQREVAWAVWYFLGVAFVLLMLATVRGKLAMREASRLYRGIEESATARRQLLVDVLRSSDHDRHRVAAQLHQQATAFYVAFTSFLRLSDGEETHPSIVAVRKDLERQADELQELMLAVRPLDANHDGASDLRSTVIAYMTSLYADAAVPKIDVRIDGDLEMDWTTETILMRILQEALRNVAKHAHAAHVIVSIDVEEAGVVLRVIDDGVGFDPKRLLFESGNDYMRNFAAHVGGHVFIESEPGNGTTLRAVLGVAGVPRGGDQPPLRDTNASSRRGHLRLVTTDPPDRSQGRDTICERPASRDSLGDELDVPLAPPVASTDILLTGVNSRLARCRADSSSDHTQLNAP